MLCTNRIANTPQRRVMEWVSLPTATACPQALMTAAKAAMGRLFAPNYLCKKAVVLLTNLVAMAEYQPSLLEPALDQPLLDATMHALNRRYNHRLVHHAACGLNPTWAMRAQTRSPSYTTRWAVLRVVG